MDQQQHQQQQDPEIMRLYTVYFDPADYPGKYVVRGSSILQNGNLKMDQEPLIVTDSHEAARAAIPAWMVMIMRSPGDDACILESWL